MFQGEAYLVLSFAVGGVQLGLLLCSVSSKKKNMLQVSVSQQDLTCANHNSVDVQP